jgi:hypothetical protein
VTDLDAWQPGAARQVARALESSVQEAAMLLRTDLTHRALMELPLLAEHATLQRPRISFRSFEPLESWLGREATESPICATFDILRATFQLVPPDLRHVFVATVVMCRREVARREIGAQLGVGKDKLRRLYDECGLPAFPDINAELLGAHVLSGAERGASERACAEWAGFDGVSSLDKYLDYHFSCRLAALRRERGLNAQVDRIVAWFRRGQSSSVQLQIGQR